MRPIRAKPDVVKKIVLAACALHNYLRASDGAVQAIERYIPPRYADYYSAQDELIGGLLRSETVRGIVTIERPPGGANKAGHFPKPVRNRFARYFMSEEGSLPWQIDYVNRGGRPARSNEVISSRQD